MALISLNDLCYRKNSLETEKRVRISRGKRAIGVRAIEVYAASNADVSRKHAYIILTPVNPTFILYNRDLQVYTLFFLFLPKNIDCRYSLEPPRRGGSNVYPQSIFWAELWKIS